MRDAQGNVLAIYSKKGANALQWNEQDLYGSSRIGLWRWDTIVPATPPIAQTGSPIQDSLMIGARNYELTNHLGNVLSTISDKKIGHDSSGVVNYYIAEVLSQNDYYPCGMMMPGRRYEATSSYRYGFNGQEKSIELKNEGSSYTAEFWQYDSRIGRRWNADPKPSVSQSVYNSFANNPLIFGDPLGDTLNLPSKPEYNRTNSVNDINSLVKPDNLKFISVNDNGQVTLKGNPQELKQARLKDAGFELLSNLIEAQEHFYYSVNYTTRINAYDLSVPGSPPTSQDDGLDMAKYPVGSTISYDQTKTNVYAADGRTVVGEVSDIQSTISNISKTLRGDEISFGNIQRTPSRTYQSGATRKTYDGVVRIAPGEYYNTNGTIKVVVPRAAIIFHELYENYFRTHYKSGYPVAHPAAIEMERIFSHFTNLGDAPKFFLVK